MTTRHILQGHIAKLKIIFSPKSILKSQLSIPQRGPPSPSTTGRDLPPPSSVQAKSVSPTFVLSEPCGRPLPPLGKNGERTPVLPLAAGPGRLAELWAAEGGTRYENPRGFRGAAWGHRDQHALVAGLYNAAPRPYHLVPLHHLILQRFLPWVFCLSFFREGEKRRWVCLCAFPASPPFALVPRAYFGEKWGSDRTLAF